MKNRDVKQFALGIMVAVLAMSTPVSATIITFDDIPIAPHPTLPGITTSKVISDDYQGLTFSNFGVVAPLTYLPETVKSLIPLPLINSGFAAGIVSPSNVASNLFGRPATIDAVQGFTLSSGYFTAAWLDDLILSVDASLGGASVYSQTFALSATAPTLIDFGNILTDSVTFSSSGSTQHPGYTAGSGTNFVLDNLSINASAAVPESATWAMMIVGFGLVGFMVRRDRSSFRSLHA